MVLYHTQEEDSTMCCARRQGFMVIDIYLNLEGERNKVWINSWRCVNRGESRDASILRNCSTRRHVNVTLRQKKAA